MAHTILTRRNGWGRTAWYGAEIGVGLSFLYALAFIAYAVVRSTSVLLGTPNPDGGLAGTLIATWATLALPALMIAALAGILAAAIGALTALAVRMLASFGTARPTPRRAAGSSLAVCLVVCLALLLLLTQGLGLVWTPATAETLTFWLVLPLIIYIIAGGVVGWHFNRLFAACW
jgi:hypothetical protein